MDDMIDRVSDAARDRNLSGLAIGKHLVRRAKTELSERAVGNRVAGLFRRQAVHLAWWSEHRSLLRALCKLLEVPYDEMVEGLRSRPVPLLDLPEFPRLRGLDVRRERPLVLTDPDLLGPPTFPCHGVAAGRGMGLTFAIRYHELRGARVLRIPTTIKNEARLESLKNLRDEASLTGRLVVMLGPETTWIDHPTWRMLEDRPETWLFTRGAPSLTSWWSRLALIDDWRAKLVNWLAERAGSESGWTADMVLRWLYARDPESKRFRTPQDVVRLCAIVDEDGFDRIAENEMDGRLAERWLEQVVSERGRRPGPRRRADAIAIRALRAMVEARFGRTSLPWTGPLSIAQWRELAPVAPGSGIVGTLVGEGLLLEVPGGVVVAPEWLDEQWARTAAHELLSNEPEIWGSAAASVARQPWIDQELASRVESDPKILERHARAVVKRAENRDTPLPVAIIGATEAMFACVGRSDPKTPWQDHAALIALAKLQTTLIRDHHDDRGFLPLTRRLPWADGWDHNRWIACGWTWSFTFGRPGDLGTAPAWFLPGWCETIDEADLADIRVATHHPPVNVHVAPQGRSDRLFAEIKTSITGEPYSERTTKALGRSGSTSLADAFPYWWRLLSFGGEVLRRLTRDVGVLPNVVRVPAIWDVPERMMSLTPTELRDLVNIAWSAEYLAARLQISDDAETWLQAYWKAIVNRGHAPAEFFRDRGGLGGGGAGVDR